MRERPLPRPALRDPTGLSWGRWASPWAMTLALVGVVTLLRALDVLALSPYPLIEDEAHYWEWSRRLDWSYYSKGPGIALLIRLSTLVFGDTEGGVRMVAVLSSAVTALAIAGLTRDVFRASSLRGRAGFFAAAVFFLTPMFQITSTISTIDGPYLACWALGAWAARRAIRRGSRSAWAALGLSVAAGFLVKYTILLLVPGVVLYVLLHKRSNRAVRAKPLGPLLALVLASLGLIPVLVWNAQHDWDTVRHLLGHLGVEGGDVPSSGKHSEPYSPHWTLELIGIQIGGLAATSAMIAAAVGGALRHRGRSNPNWPGQLFCMCLAAPILLFYLAVTFFTDAEGNWPIAGFLTLIAMAGYTLVNGMVIYKGRVAIWHASPEPRRRAGFFRRQPETFRQATWTTIFVLGLISALILARPGHAAVLLERTTGIHISLGRLLAGQSIANDAHALGEQLENETAQRPVYIAQHYGRASLLAFYLPGRPVVYCASSMTEGRRTQYDLWPETDLARPELLGVNAVLLGASRPQWERFFERVEEIEGGLPSDHKSRPAFLGYSCTGFGGGAP